MARASDLSSPLVEFPLNDPAYDNTTSSIFVALIINSLIGAACILGFLVARTFTREYHLRMVLKHVTMKPPVVPVNGVWGAFSWLKVVICTSDVWLLHSAGLDALVLQKSHALGIQIFLPVAILGCCMLMPLQLAKASENGDATFSRLTMANIGPHSIVLWAHWVCVLLFLGWTMLLLDWHFQEYVSLRQFYLRGVDGYNYWRELHMAEADGVSIQHHSKFARVVETAHVDAILNNLELGYTRPRVNWWRKKMAWITSWTGSGTAEDVVQLAEELTAQDANSDIIRSLRSHASSVQQASGAVGGHQSHGHHQLSSRFEHTMSGRAGARASPLSAGMMLEGVRTESGAPEQQGRAQQDRQDSQLQQQQQQQQELLLVVGESQRQVAQWPAASSERGWSSRVNTLESKQVAQEDQQQVAGMTISKAEDQVPVTSSGSPSAQPMSHDDAAVMDQPSGSTAQQCPRLEEVSGMAAPKWWSTVSVVTTEEGKLRKLTDEEMHRYQGNNVMLAKPSVRYRQTINTADHTGRPLAVRAQSYAVLVTNVTQPVYPEFTGDCPPLGAGAWGKAKFHYSNDGGWTGLRHQRLAQEAANANTTMPPQPAATPPGASVGALNAASTLGEFVASHQGVGAVASLDMAEARVEEGAVLRHSPTLGSAPGSLLDESPRSPPSPPLPSVVNSSGRAAELWGRARAAMADGRLHSLGVSEQYSVVSAVFSALFPDDFDRVVPVFNFREADLLMREWDNRMGELELAEHAVRLGDPPKAIKPSGWKCRVDRIEWLKGEVARLERAVLEARDRALIFNCTPSFFVLFRTQRAAAIAASCNIHPLKKELFKVHPAPGPEEVNWEALWFTHAQRVFRGLMVTPFIILLVLLPVSMLTSAMTQLNDAICDEGYRLRWKDYCASSHPVHNVLRSMLTGFVPALLIQLWQGLLMPCCVFFAAQSEARHYSLSGLDRRMGAIYFLWSGLNFFVGGVVGSIGTALTKTVPKLVNDPLHTPETLGYFLPASSKFFFAYMILRTFLSIPLRFLIPHGGVWQAWIRMALRRWIKTFDDNGVPERTSFMRNSISSPQYGIEYGGNICLVALICFAFAVICPLIPLFGAAFFAGQWLYWRYQLIYCNQRKYESGGLFFPFLADRIMVSAAVMVAFTGCVMIIKQAWVQASLMWTIGFVSLYAYYKRTRDLYLHGLREMPLLVAQMAPRARVPATVYIPPPLQANGFLWHPEHNKPWEFCGLPAYSI